MEVDCGRGSLGAIIARGADTPYDLGRMHDVQTWGRLWGRGWQVVALLATVLVMALAALCRSALANDGAAQEPPVDQTSVQENAPPGAESSPVVGEPSPAETPGRADEGGPVQVPARPAVQRPKLDGALAVIAETVVTSGDEAALVQARTLGLTVVGGRVRVLIQYVSSDLTNADTVILTVGGTNEAAYADTIQALVPPSGLDRLAASPDVLTVRSPAGRMPDGPPSPGRAR